MTHTAASEIAVLSSAGGGGAGIAARRVVGALNSLGHFSADFVDIETLGHKVPQSVSPEGSVTNRTISDTYFTVEFPAFARGWMVEFLASYDLVNIHWASHLVSISELLSLALRGKPMLFTLHDFYYATGGCHYPASCDQLALGCPSCPQVDTARCDQAVIKHNSALKRQLFSLPNVHLSAPSAFVRDTVVGADVIPVERAHVLRNIYDPIDDFDPERPFTGRVLLIADSLHEGRKNMPFALEVLARLHELGAVPFHVDLVGYASQELKDYMATRGVPHSFHGRVTDHGALTRIMQQTDVVLTTSLEDNWPNTLVEAGSYGCMPVVGPGHGCAEFVEHFSFGVVAQNYSVDSFVTALLHALTQRSKAARSEAVCAIRHVHAPATFVHEYSALIDSHILARNENTFPRSSVRGSPRTNVPSMKEA